MQLEMAVMAQQREALALRHRTLMAESQDSDRPSLLSIVKLAMGPFEISTGERCCTFAGAEE